MSNLIKGMVLPLTEDHRIFLPCEAVAEIIHYIEPDKFIEHDIPNFLMGVIDWRGFRVPVVCLESLYFNSFRHIQVKSKIAIIDGFSNSEDNPYLGVLLSYYPTNLIIQSQDQMRVVEKNQQYIKFMYYDQILILPSLDYLYENSSPFFNVVAKKVESMPVLPNNDSFPT
jgi:chemotaxis signal transduction protein